MAQGPYGRLVAEKKIRGNERDQRVSLHGLDPEEALRALLAVKPGDDAEGDKPGDDSSPRGESSRPER